MTSEKKLLTEFTFFIIDKVDPITRDKIHGLIEEFIKDRTQLTMGNLPFG